MSIKDALQLKDMQGTLPDGTAFTLRRPSVLDLVEAIEFTKTNPTQFYAWLVQKHLVEDGKQVFASVDEILKLDANLVNHIAGAAEKLYGEGRD